MKEFLKFAIKQKYADLDVCPDRAQQRKEIARLWRLLRTLK